MIYSTKQYSAKFLQSGKRVHPRTIKRKCIKNNLPSNHKPIHIDGHWLIDVQEEFCSNCVTYGPSQVFDDEGRCMKFDPSRSVHATMRCPDHKIIGFDGF